MWRAIRWRAGSSLMFLAVGIAAIATASTGPIYIASADQSVLDVQLAAEPPAATGFTISNAFGGAASSPADLLAVAPRLPGGVGPGKRFETPIITLDVGTEVANPLTGGFEKMDVISRSGVCAQVSIVRGACPTSPNEVLLSTRSAAKIGAHLGSRLLPFADAHKMVEGPPIKVSGLYVAPPGIGPYWWNSNPFKFDNPPPPYKVLDAGFVTQAGAERLAKVLPTSIMAQFPLDPSLIPASGVPAVMSQLTAFSAQLASEDLSGSTSVGAVFSSVAAEEKQMKSVIAVVALELILLALLVLYGVSSSMSVERRPDMAVAELRGLTRGSIAVLALREPAVLLAVATPAGLALGWVIVRALAAFVFAGHTPVRIDSLAVGSIAATFVAGLLASAAGARALIRPSVMNETVATAARRTARALVLGDAIALVLAAVAVTELVTGKGATADLSGSGASGAGATASNPVAAVAPALVGLAAGIVAAYLLPVVCRAVARSTRWSRRVVTGLACRSVMRRPGMARRVLVPAISIALLVFSVASYEVASSNRATQALFSTGAPVVLDVKMLPGIDLVSAVRKADPTGHEAMAVATVQLASGNLLAVDSSRFAAVAAWPAGASSTTAATVARYLSPPTAPPLILRHIAEMRLGLDLTHAVFPAPVLQVSLFDDQVDEEESFNVGLLKAGSHEYAVSTGDACAQACRLDSFTLYWTPAAGSSTHSVTVPVRFADMAIRPTTGPWKTVEAGFSEGRDWTGSSPAVSTAPTAAGLVSVFHVDTSAAPPELIRGDAPALLPAVVTSSFVSLNGNPSVPDQYPAFGIDGTSITVESTIQASSLPALGDDGVLVDLSLAERIQTSRPLGTTFEVWCHRPPSAALLQALSRDGVNVVATHSFTTEDRLLNRSGPALAFELFLLAAIAAALLSLGALVFAIASSSRKRAIEVAALAAVGVPRSILRRSLLAEYGVVVTAGVVLGFVSGIVTIRLALNSLPEFVPGRVGPVLFVWVPWALVLIAAGSALFLLLAGAALATALVMRRATPDCLRTAL